MTVERDQIIEAGARASYEAYRERRPDLKLNRPWEDVGPNMRRGQLREAEIHYDAMAPLIRQQTAEALAEPMRRLRTVLIASAHLLDVPFTNAPELSPWTRGVKPALERLDAAIARTVGADAGEAREGVSEPRSGDNGARPSESMPDGPGGAEKPYGDEDPRPGQTERVQRIMGGGQ